MNNIVIWIVFGVLLAAIVGFLIFTFFRDKQKNRKLTQKKLELKRATIKSSKKLAIRIYTLIEKNQDWLKKVEPGISKIKMKHVNSSARIFLKEIYDSKPFKVIYIDSLDSDPEFARNLNKLIEKNSNLWQKYLEQEINYFKKFHDELKSDENFDSLKQTAIKDIDEVFLREIEK